MKKLFMVLCVLLMFFGIVGCPSSDDPVAPQAFKSSVTQTSVTPADVSLNQVPEPATLILLGTGLVGLAGYGRKKYKK